MTRFHYTNVVHPKLAVITGMTRDGTFLVRSGEIVGPVRNLRFTQSYLDALAAVEAVSAERRLLRGELGAVLVPAVRIGALALHGGDRGRLSGGRIRPCGAGSVHSGNGPRTDEPGTRPRRTADRLRQAPMPL